MTYSLASIAPDAEHAARQGRTANPFPEADPAHAIWADCFAAASAARDIPQPANLPKTTPAHRVPAHIAGAL